MTPSTPGLKRSISAFKSSVLTILLAFSLILMSGAQAQERTPAADTDSTSDTAQVSSYATLADLLEDPETRNELVDQLRELAAQPNAPDATAPAAQETSPAATEPPATHIIHGSDIALRLQHFGDQLQDDLAGSWNLVSTMLSGHSTHGATIERWMPALYSLALAIVTVSIAYALLRVVANPGFTRINNWITKDTSRTGSEPANKKTKPHHHGLLHVPAFARGRKLLGVLFALVLDLIVTLLAGLAGYAAVIAFTQPGAQVSLFSMQFLTAFIIVESIKALSRGVFATRYEHLRLLPMSEDAARYWNRWLVVIITITGYSLLVVVPIVQTLLTPAVGHLLGLVLMIAVYLYAVRVVWSKRLVVRAGLNSFAEQSNAAVFGTLTRIMARIWHWMILAYLTILFVISQTKQQEALSFMGKATAQTLLAVLVGTIAAATLSTLASRRIRLPDQWGKMLPSLETRLNSYVPAFLKGLRFFILILVTLVVLDAWEAFNLLAWLSSETGQAAVSTLIHVGIILLIAALGWSVLASMIEHRVGTSSGRNIPTQREKTLLMLFRNAAAITIATMTVLVVLSQIGIDIGPLIAGAGVAGLAIGFGAQKLVQDVITGVFIQVENGMNQNDTVELAGLFGTVEKITIRSVGIRTLDGGYHLVPFSAIDTVTNHTRDYGNHVGEYRVAHRESVDDAIVQLRLAFKALMQDSEMAALVLEDISIPGVTSLNEHGFTIRAMIKTTPGNQWAIQRAYNRLVKEHFDAAGIEVPYPQTVLHFGRDKNGMAAPLDVRHIKQLNDDFQVDSAPGQTVRALENDSDISVDTDANVVEDVEVDTDANVNADRNTATGRIKPA